MRDKSWIGKGQNKEEYCEKFKEVFCNCTVRCIVCNNISRMWQEKDDRAEGGEY